MMWIVRKFGALVVFGRDDFNLANKVVVCEMKNKMLTTMKKQAEPVLSDIHYLYPCDALQLL